MNEKTNTVEGRNAINKLLCPVDYPVVWEGRQYKEIEKFDCHVVKLKYELNGCGGYMTVIPISPKKYREEERQTKAAVVITENAGWTLFSIYSDWGQCYEMNIHNSLAKEIKEAKNAAEEQGLLLNGA